MLKKAELQRFLGASFHYALPTNDGVAVEQEVEQKNSASPVEMITFLKDGKHIVGC